MQPYADLYSRNFKSDKIVSLNFSGMSGALAIVEALRKAGPDLTRDRFIAALESIRDLDAGPAACRITFGQQDHQGCKTGTVWQLVGGRAVNVGATWRKMDGA